MNQVILLLSGLAGFVFQSLLKMKSLNDLSRAANMTFHPYKDYIQKDIYGILLAFISPFIWLLLFGEAAARFPKIQGWAMTSFFVFGSSGSYIIQLALGRAKSEIRNVIDKKTDKADGKTNNVN